MEFGINELAFLPIRQGLSDRSEMLSQVLFGECFKVLINREDWCRIQTISDNYEGWVCKKGVSFLSEDELNKLNKTKKLFYDSLQTVLIKNNQERIQVPIGSVFPNLKGDEFSIRNNLYKLETPLNKKSKISDKRNYILDIAQKMINTPYLWGGRTAWGIDCSGFIQLLYAIIGIHLPRDANQQVNIGSAVNFISESQIGDLVFFDDEEGNIIHVGILKGKSQIIHASQKVRIDTIDHQGIYNNEIKRYTHNLRVIKSVLS